MMYLQALFATHVAQHFPYRGVLNFARVHYVLNGGVDDSVLVIKERRQMAAVDIAVLVDRGGYHHATLVAIPPWVVSAPAKEGDAIRRASQYHRLVPKQFAFELNARHLFNVLTLHKAELFLDEIQIQRIREVLLPGFIPKLQHLSS